MDFYKVDTQPVILLIDAAHMLRRNIYQPSLRELSNSTGMPTGGIYGFMKSLLASINLLNAQSVILCHEGGHSERRLQIYNKYKDRGDNAESERDNHGMTDYEYYSHQLSWIEKLLEFLGVRQIRVLGKEGDDVLYQVIHLIRGKKIIISEDKDFLTLISKDVSQYRPICQEFINLDTFENFSNGYKSPLHFLYGKVILGDGSDNIPSISKGVGQTTVLSVLNKIKESDLSVKSILRVASEIDNFRTRKIIDAGESVLNRNIDLIDMSREHFDVFQLQSIEDNLTRHPSLDIAKAMKILSVLEFNTQTSSELVSRLSQMANFSLEDLINKDYIKSTIGG